MSESIILKVHQFIEFCNEMLGQFEVQVEGEVSSFQINRGKFVFFDLKDEEKEAKIGCFAMSFALNTPIEDGMRVIITGKPGLYQKNGQFRLSVSRVELVGEGSLKRSFELLKQKLDKEGLFEPSRKRRLTRYVQSVGIISSVDAAGFGDFCRIAWQRLPGVKYTLANVAVQGKDAEREIVAAFDYLNSHYHLDAIVLIRGGGSLEDLQAFNSEHVARAILRSKAPVIVGVGHEKDISIADFVADVRAATPSNAAQILLPTKEDVVNYVIRLCQQGQRANEQNIHRTRDKITNIVRYISQQNHNKIQNIVQKIQYISKNIESLAPINVLKRGYALVFDSAGTLISTQKQAQKINDLIIQFQDGKICAKKELM